MLEESALLAIHARIRGDQEIVGGEEKTAGAAGWIGDGLARQRPHALHHCPDQRARREILPRPRLGILGIAFQQALVNVALHIGTQRHPLGFVHHVDQPRQLGRVLDLVLCLCENLPEQPRLDPQLAQRRHVMHLQLRPALHLQAWPGVIGGNADLAAVRRPAVLVGHLQEDQVGQLFEIVAIADPIVAQRSTEAPDAGDDGGGGIHEYIPGFYALFYTPRRIGGV